MTGMNIQERYDDICKKSGLSEDIVRRVFKATRESLAYSLKHGERATLPGIVTMTPEIRNKLNIGADSMTSYIKVKASPSSAMETELGKLEQFTSDDFYKDEEEKQEQQLARLNFADPDKKSFGVRTSQISALL